MHTFSCASTFHIRRFSPLRPPLSPFPFSSPTSALSSLYYLFISPLYHLLLSIPFPFFYIPTFLFPLFSPPVSPSLYPLPLPISFLSRHFFSISLFSLFFFPLSQYPSLFFLLPFPHPPHPPLLTNVFPLSIPLPLAIHTLPLPLSPLALMFSPHPSQLVLTRTFTSPLNPLCLPSPYILLNISFFSLMFSLFHQFYLSLLTPPL